MTAETEQPAVLSTLTDGICTLTLNRPGQRNALTAEIRAHLTTLMQQVRDDSNVRVLVVRGAGGAFCAGGDMQSMLRDSLSGPDWRSRIRKQHVWLDILTDLEKPVIASVDGPAYGAGLGLALAADFILATQRARFCAIFGRVGLAPDLGTMYLLPRIVGRQRAKEIVFTTRVIAATEAHELGMVFQIVEDADGLARATSDLARRLCATSPVAFGVTKSIMNQSFELDARAMADLEAYAQAVCHDTDYHQDALQRFRDKRAPRLTWD
ncbi:enoyl-CoA hydratase/isomerase family protein [Castellaniella sp.]|uniref:enoyl-CoA hydratase/isomerase family protein n=1 Tax=Castellaniella sp. TaxID=1955812 RepID=UPI00355E9001